VFLIEVVILIVGVVGIFVVLVIVKILVIVAVLMQLALIKLAIISIFVNYGLGSEISSCWFVLRRRNWGLLIGQSLFNLEFNLED
jgi:hypothetical protein